MRNLVTRIHDREISVPQEKSSCGYQVSLIPYPDYGNQVIHFHDISWIKKARCNPVLQLYVCYLVVFFPRPSCSAQALLISCQ